MRKALFFAISFMALYSQLFAQYSRVPFEEPDSLIVDLTGLFQRPDAEEQDSLVSGFQSVYDGLDETQKTHVYSIFSGMYAKRLALKPHFIRFMKCVENANTIRNLSHDEFTRFLEVTDTTVQFYKRGVMANFLKQSEQFLTSDTVYRSQYNSMIMIKGSFSFDHVPDLERMGGDLYASTDEATEEEGILLGEEEEEDKEEWFEGEVVEEEGELMEETSLDADEGWSSSDDGWGSSDGWSTAEDAWSDSGDDGWSTAEDSWATEDTTALISDGGTEEAMLTETVLYEIPEPILPPVTGPFIKITDADFVLLSVYDTLDLKEVNASLLLKNDTLVAESGKITWKNVGLPEEEVFAELGKFSFDFHNPEFISEDAKLTYNTQTEGEIPGVLEYKSHIHNNKPEKAQYPRFKSYHANIVIEDLVDDVTYRGGVSLEGKKFKSNSVFHGGESLIRYEGSTGNKFTARSKKGFSFADSLLYSPKAEFVIHYSEEDSISHPAVELKYHTNDKLLQARKDKRDYKISQFVDTRNDVNISADFLEWSVEADSFDLEILNARDRIPLVVESKDYFDKYRFIALKGNYNFHPLQMVVGYSNKVKKNTFYSANMARSLKQNPDVVKGAMVELSRRGYITYDTKTDIIDLQRKAKLYVYAMQGRRGVDYDNMIMHSRTTDKPNLTVSLEGKDFSLEGVDQFMISDSMKVLVTPQDGKVNLKDGRNTTFGGEMRAGNFVFRGPEFTYNYDSFNVNLEVIDSIGILVTHDDGVKKELANNIVQTGGILYISNPKNKSGRKSMERYPILDAKKGGAIYFDGQEILSGAYDHRIRFEIPPFVIDSLNDNNTDVITFDGTFKTEGIFPDFKQVISIQPDYSFGFKRQMNSAGVPLYNDKAKYYNEITLNNKGIRGRGKIEYLAGSFESKDFIFYSDSVHTRGEQGEIVAGEFNGASYPSVKMQHYKMRWLVDNDSMLLTNDKEAPFEIYDPSTKFEGTLALTSDNLKGSGKIETPNSLNKSKDFQMEASKYVARNSEFIIKSNDPNTPGLLGDNVKVEYDLGERVAVATSEVEGENSFTLPYIQYETNISQVLWNLDQHTLVMSVDSENEMGLGKFTSNNRRQDSLEIFASDAVYDLNEHILNLEGVPYITIANVRVIPDSGRVFVRENANIDELNNATIEMNAFNKFHTLTDANIKIISRNKFEGEASYQYTMGVNDPYEIRFTNFNIEKAKEEKGQDKTVEFITSAQAEIREDDEFKFLPGFIYKGKLTMLDYEKYLKFDGEVALDVERANNGWFAYKSENEETHGVIQVDENLKAAGYPTKLSTGIFLSKIDRDFYPSMVHFDRDRVNDFTIFQGRGNLIFDDSTKNYILATQEKLDNPEGKGNLFIYNFENHQVEFDGELNLVENTKDYIIKATGKGNGNYVKEEYDINSQIYFNIPQATGTSNNLANDILDNVEEVISPFEESDQVVAKLTQILTQKQLDEYLYKYRNGNESFAAFFGEGIMFSDVNLKWSSEYRSLYSTGDLGLGNVFKGDVNSLVTGYIEIPKSETDYDAKVFVMASEENWFYFSFQKEGVHALSSNATFNETLAGKKGGGSVSRASNDELLGYLSSFRMNYLGIDDMLDIYIPEDGAVEDIDQELIDSDIFGDVVDEGLPKEEKSSEDEDDDDDDDGF
ncbi:hypothetical protein [Chondrinema litorale]|uniref:hypothetical protein n=1 Tax=Chondrinema litorale TaxID=2994555 RepID=UPI00254281F5|nr:hypothetical protein [Chondrinema litorale]UZR95909.1 hypothetical protein OQ292_08790 [Chondrinema litorale]